MAHGWLGHIIVHGSWVIIYVTRVGQRVTEPDPGGSDGLKNMTRVGQRVICL